MSNRLSKQELEDIIRYMCREQKKGNFTPILEADVVAFLYHLFIRQLKIQACRIHVNSRVRGAENPNKKPDIVLGKVNLSGDQGEVDAGTIIEVKAFPKKFPKKKCYHRFKSIVESDLPKLRTYGPLKARLFQLIYDEQDYLSRGVSRSNIQYIEGIKEELRKYRSSIKVLLAQRQNRNWLIRYL